jgi:hypothetical protein
MEAIYFGNFSSKYFGNFTGAGKTGPWVGADMENGIFCECGVCVRWCGVRRI